MRIMSHDCTCRCIYKRIQYVYTHIYVVYIKRKCIIIYSTSVYSTFRLCSVTSASFKFQIIFFGFANCLKFKWSFYLLRESVLCKSMSTPCVCVSARVSYNFYSLFSSVKGVTAWPLLVHITMLNFNVYPKLCINVRFLQRDFMLTKMFSN